MGENSKESSRTICLLNASHAALLPEDAGARLCWKTPQQFPGGSLKCRSNIRAARAAVRGCCGQGAHSHPPFLLHPLPGTNALFLQPAVPFSSCSCHQLSEAGSLPSPSLSCLKSSSAIIPGLSRVLGHIGSDNNGSQSKDCTTCPFVQVSKAQHSKTWPFLWFPPGN